MNKHTILALALCIFGAATVITLANQPAKTKQEKIAVLCDVVMSHEQIQQMFAGIFINAQITDKTAQERVVETFYNEAKKEMSAFYDAQFDEADIDILHTFFVSETGRKFCTSTNEQNVAMQKAMQSAMMIIQEHMMAQMQNAASAHTAEVIDFTEQAHGKTDAQVKEAFNDIINQDGITVVKCSSLMCEPCKVYAPLFDEVAQELQELQAGDQKIGVRYVALDVNAVMAIAQEYRIKSVPTTIFFKDGKKIDSHVGMMHKHVLRSRIEELAQ